MKQFINSRLAFLVTGLLEQALYEKPKTIETYELRWDNLVVSDRSIKFKICYDYDQSLWVTYHQERSEYMDDLVKELFDKWGK